MTFGALLAVALLSACATTGPSADNEIGERAQARWDALLEGDFATAYSYLSPGYRSRISVVDYELSTRMKRVQYRSAQYQEHTCEKDVCTVQVKIEYKVAKPVPGVAEFVGENTIFEQWIKSDSNWWFLPQK